MEWRFKKMSRDESRDKSCLVEFFNADLFKDFMIPGLLASVRKAASERKEYGKAAS